MSIKFQDAIYHVCSHPKCILEGKTMVPCMTWKHREGWTYSSMHFQ